MMDFLAAMGGTATGLFGTLIPFLFVLTVVVFVHELGHFLVGRWCGVGVTAFSIGFGPELFGFNDRRGTRWKLSAIPLGGYVKFHGDANGASVADPEALARMSAAERAVSFQGQNVAKRSAIVAAGPVANFLLAIAIFAGALYIGGRREIPAEVGSVAANSPAAAAGFRPGDVVTAIDGSRVLTFEDIQRAIEPSAGSPLRFSVLRDGRSFDIEATPAPDEDRTPLGTVRLGRLGLGSPRIPPVVGGVAPGGAAARGGLEAGDRVLTVDGVAVDSFQALQQIIAGKPGAKLAVEVGRGGATRPLELVPDTVRDESDPSAKAFGRLGIEPAQDPSWSRIVYYGPADAIRLGARETWFIVERTFGYLGRIVRGRESADQLSGPIGIARVSGQVAKIGGFAPLVNLIAVLSVSIGLINLFPIPLLDGGHLLFYACEVVRGRPLSERAQEIGFRIGLAIVLMLMLFATWNDLLRIGASWTGRPT